VQEWTSRTVCNFLCVSTEGQCNYCTDFESGRVGFKVFVVCRQYVNPDTIAMRGSEAFTRTAVNMPRYVISNQLSSLLGGKGRPLHAV
jgi:hypothetical protein